tara:strand:+ start:173 stop:724 length:552 start_codon:yes stop_codon:yes gene_type:complete
LKKIEIILKKWIGYSLLVAVIAGTGLADQISAEKNVAGDNLTVDERLADDDFWIKGDLYHLHLTDFPVVYDHGKEASVDLLIGYDHRGFARVETTYVRDQLSESYVLYLKWGNIQVDHINADQILEHYVLRPRFSGYEQSLKIMISNLEAALVAGMVEHNTRAIDAAIDYLRALLVAVREQEA